ncbi:DUF6261 family protein [Streptococcus sp. HMSC061D10]|uniref:DUF6261 family protein n=1 Tax=Streptococcus sp. HMSC061D10 TaxID=1715207 RepID=UPI0008B7B110|nr:DUF6261 family protein [Streptococcus sp. HMSC061D10]OFN79565.1 hypothetical protein HMPREF2728_09225 [Streptococcus sp. HMSC061D10]
MKKGYGITSLTVRNLENNEFFQLLSESKNELWAFTKANKSEQVYATKLGDMEKLLETLQAGLHRSKASQTVASLEAFDRERDDALSTLTGLIKAFSHVKEASSKEAYDKLSKFFKNYAGLTSMSYEKETEAINHLLKEIKDTDYQTALATLHLTTHVETLIKAQAQFEKAYKERLAEQKGKASSQNKEVRVKLQEIYDFLVDFTAINAYAYPDKKQYADLRDHLNAIRSRYKKRKPAMKVTEAVGSVN